MTSDFLRDVTLRMRFRDLMAIVRLREPLRFDFALVDVRLRLAGAFRRLR